MAASKGMHRAPIRVVTAEKRMITTVDVRNDGGEASRKSSER